MKQNDYHNKVATYLSEAGYQSVLSFVEKIPFDILFDIFGSTDGDIENFNETFLFTIKAGDNYRKVDHSFRVTSTNMLTTLYWTIYEDVLEHHKIHDFEYYTKNIKDNEINYYKVKSILDIERIDSLLEIYKDGKLTSFSEYVDDLIKYITSCNGKIPYV